MSDFITAPDYVEPRLVLSLEGRHRAGRTHFALTAPKPLVYFPFDRGLSQDFVVSKFSKKHPGKILVPPVDLCLPPVAFPDLTGNVTTKKGREENDPAMDAYRKLMAREAQKVWSKFMLYWERALQEAATVVIDTASEQWELLRLARLGKLTQVMPHHYTEVNSEYKSLLNMVNESDANLILIHQLKEEWQDKVDASGQKKGTKTGRWERAGFSKIDYLLHASLRLQCDEEGDFSAEVLDCHQNSDLMGDVLEGPMSTFPMFAAQVFDSDPEEWM